MILSAAKRKYFPDPRLTLAEGLVMVGGQLDVETLLEAYSYGIFPWPQDGLPLLWFCPEWRGVLDFDEIHLSRSFQKFLRANKYQVTFNQAFSQVVNHCAEVPRPGQSGTWITPEIQGAYAEFHRQGYAQSIECWEGDQLVAGLYGVYVAGVFAGESMFFKKPNTSKLCLHHLIVRLKEHGLKWMDIQMVSDGLKPWGGKYISRDQYLKRLELARGQAKPLRL